jgi:hypothetical protein
MGEDHHVVMHILENKYGGSETFNGGFNIGPNNLGTTLEKDKLTKKTMENATIEEITIGKRKLKKKIDEPKK